jgi:hypothetical protein
MNFVEYLPKIHINIGNTPKVIIESNVNTLYINSISICNKTINDIRISLVKRIKGDDFSVKEGFICENIKINSPTSKESNVKSTINLISHFGLTTFLPVFKENEINYTCELLCYSNGITQKFDCIVDYTNFVETPIA